MIPKFVYHYTSIDALEKIYTTRKILFKRLDMLNDPYEGIIHDPNGIKIKNPRKCIYCSCWTADERESIAMWGVYNRFQGVRIKMFSRMFSDSFSLQEIEDGFIPVEELPSTIVTKNRTSLTDESISISRVYGPYSISYVPKLESTYIGSIHRAESHEGILPGEKSIIEICELGNRKVDFWQYESEWRYKISPYSRIYAKLSDLDSARVDDICDEESILVPYQGDILEIMLAPCIEPDTEQRLHKLLGDKYDKLVKRSSIRMRKM